MCSYHAVNSVTIVHARDGTEVKKTVTEMNIGQNSCYRLERTVSYYVISYFNIEMLPIEKFGFRLSFKKDVLWRLALPLVQALTRDSERRGAF